ncbi:cytochrome c oxidase subunit 3 family protein [Bosea sp. F3-2]|uniref:cytochrome c oxidase subunit 3 family protein n=1 Tax=Bosea sp. F3-2 TaxID=2599640 RepID=UPI0020C05EB7|nr:cytochrome c oxidase subunit 3 family protein [Bosea sp. F3-2]
MNVAIRSGLGVAQPETGNGIELLLWILIWSELIVFGALLGAFLLLGMIDPPALAALRGELDLTLAGIATVVLVSSGFFAARAASGHHPRRNLVAAALGGFTFCALKIAAFARELPVLAATEGRLPELYMLVVGFHFAHVAFVAGLLLLVAWRPTPRHVAAVATVWHLVDLVWLLILPVIYLG